MQIADKVAIVTGAANGIGRAVAEALSARRARALALVDLDPGVQAVAEQIQREDHGIKARAYVGNTTDEAFRRATYEQIRAELGLPTICVPAAGITRDALAVKMDKQTGRPIIYPISDFRLVAEVNLVAPVYWALELVAGIAQDRWQKGRGRWEPAEGLQGAVIFIGSVSSQGNVGQIAYAAAKAGEQGVAATLMKEAIYHGVRCMVLHPGFTDTPMVRKLDPKYIAEHILPFTQLRRLIRPEEIADAVCFMISNPAVSGEIWADAGWHPRA